MNHPPNDTIVALATPPGKGSLACIRISGPQSFTTMAALLPPGKSIQDFPANRLSVIWLQDEKNEKVDQVTLVRYLAPHSYTGEDVVEIFCHGGKIIPGLIVELLCARGARQAKPGEFTQRALLNGKMDLIQAEAVAELVNAESPAYLAGVVTQLEGAFSKSLANLRQQLLHACALLELGLDFSEEDVEFADRDLLRQELEHLDNVLSHLLAGFSRGQACKEGWRVAIIGKPNVGKSSLMNALLKHDRVIVSALPGTTRDTIDERVLIHGLPFRLIDTAGIRAHADHLEKIGIERSRRAAREAEVILFVSDQSAVADRDDFMLAEECLELQAAHAAREQGQLVIIHARNKVDQTEAPRAFAFEADGVRALKTSALTGEGLEELERMMVASVTPTPARASEGIYFINHRQKLCLESARASLSAARTSLTKELSAEFVVLDLKEVMHQLEALVGEVTADEVLGEIFANFCIGK
ncbi:MAG: tRNA uridine-5-carboxymethylaminomethyl(34) synthesis GTPase MnmE [bacterium]